MEAIFSNLGTEMYITKETNDTYSVVAIETLLALLSFC